MAEGGSSGARPDPGALAEALTRLGDRRIVWPELCRRAGVEHEVADRLWRALGFPDVEPDDPVYTDDDVRALTIAAEGIEHLSGRDREAAIEFIVREARSVSAHLARIAEIQVDSLAEARRFGLRESTMQQAIERGVEDSDFGWLLYYVVRRRLDETIRRHAAYEEHGDQPVLSVGFIDLVDFTQTSAALDSDRFGELLDRFESLSWDIITEAGGQVVKLIGDEAMFICPTAEASARAALDVIAACAGADLPRARAGISIGPLLHRDGDYFGHAVNLASRLVDSADPDTVLADASFAEALGTQPGLALSPLGPRAIKGIGEVEVLEVAAT